MKQKKDQRVLVWCNEEEHLKTTIIDALFFSLKLGKELCFFANYHSDNEKKMFQQRIQLYAEIIKKDFPSLPVSVLLLEGKLSHLMQELSDKYDSILLFCGDKMTNYLMKAFYKSVFPFFFSKRKNNTQPSFKKVIIPIDFRKNTKEATLWGSYLGRFANSDVCLLKATGKNTDERHKVDEIVAFVQKLYSQFLFKFWVKDGKHNSWGIHSEGLKLADDYDLLIFAGSLNISALDQLFNPFEKKIINSNTQTPILLINPKKELCVLCD